MPSVLGSIKMIPCHSDYVRMSLTLPLMHSDELASLFFHLYPSFPLISVFPTSGYRSNVRLGWNHRKSCLERTLKVMHFSSSQISYLGCISNMHILVLHFSEFFHLFVCYGTPKIAIKKYSQVFF